jgi:hypothetical protein
MNQFNPINTAPKDGRRIIVYYTRQSGIPAKIVYWNKLKSIWCSEGEWVPGLEHQANFWAELEIPCENNQNATSSYALLAEAYSLLSIMKNNLGPDTFGLDEEDVVLWDRITKCKVNISRLIGDVK